MVKTMTAIATNAYPIWSGKSMTLRELGYTDVGLDDNWQQCGSYGPQKYTFHDANGVPVVNLQRFPNFSNMTSHAHGLGLTAGWYGNNCICSDHCTDDACYVGDVNALVSYGFDSVKLDGCGKQLNLTKYAALFNASGRSVLIENCHWGPSGPAPNGPTAGPDGCPWNYYRSSGDILASYASVVGNLQTTIQWAKSGLSYPGCWAYPDMLEVGCLHGPHGNDDPGLSFAEARSHFGAWCVVSSPLILSHDVTNETTTKAIWDIISNTEAIAVNQAWYGYSGSVFKEASSMVKVGQGSTSTAVPAWQYWFKPTAAGTSAVLLMNHATATTALTVNFADIPGGCTTCAVRDIWAHADLGTFTGSYTAKALAGHDSAFLLLTPA